MTWNDFDSERVQQIICQITGKQISEDKSPVPCLSLRAQGLFFYGLLSKKYL